MPTNAESGWDLTTPDIKVRLRDNPGVQGRTTGRTRTSGSFVLIEVVFGPGERSFRRLELLERVVDEADMFDLLADGSFGGPDDLRRVLVFEKIKGELTNIFYSMESSNTDFYPHQFKPVMRFIESPNGRMLIADEVGLGKTIEATYIWKEIQARQSARRLLIVCPAMLREKWRSDLRKRFNIAADIVSARDLLARLRDIAAHRTADPFVYIASLEALRPPADYEDESVSGAKAQLARLLAAYPANEGFALLDHAVIDEAHYLRNPSTGNNRLGRLLADAARNLTLLTATPIQMGSDNLYQLLRLIDPDEFYNPFLFDEILRANSAIVRAQRALWRQPPDLTAASSALADAERSEYFAKDAVLSRVRAQLTHGSLDADQLVDTLRLLEARSLLSQYMTRSRKREVLERRVERAAQTLSVQFSVEESAVYQQVSERIRRQAAGKTGVSLFSLIARQRQMASSIVGAMRSWHDKDLLEELLWDDIGWDGSTSDESLSDVDVDDLTSGRLGADIEKLQAIDGKYRALKDFLQKELARNPDEKFVVFAYFRGTLKYLQQRLHADGIRAALIMGAMGAEKDATIQHFAEPNGPSVLLSSEVGSEGIDLQFCRFLVNYDLPWNPMRIEQRIGRLDRLGQKADKISIINMVVVNTIEDRVLMRLYERINVFRESIGDLEDILGDFTDTLLVDLLNPNLTEAERESRTMEAGIALLNTMRTREQLEDEAVNLVGFSDYILDQISAGRDKGRWLSGGELITLVEDFFARNFPGTQLESSGHDAARITLSGDARRELARFIADTQPATSTALDRRTVQCVFDPRSPSGGNANIEIVDPSHPLVQWIRSRYSQDGSQLHPVAAIEVSKAEAGLAPGEYAYCVHRWQFDGIKSDRVLSFRALRLGHREELTGTDSEKLVTVAARVGRPIRNAQNTFADIAAIVAAAQLCDQLLSDKFVDRQMDFEATNSVRCDQQRTSAERLAKRRIGSLAERIAKFRERGQTRLVPATEGLIRREQEELESKLSRIQQRQQVDETMLPLAIGVISVK